jgi:pimeloyl-ACP methyl ester carboxylesterase
LLGLIRTGADFMQHWRFSPSDLERWPGQVLVLESDRDVTARSAHRDSLRRLYPRARVFTFRDAGHTPWLTHHDEYVGVVRAFIDGAGPAPSP